MHKSLSPVSFILRNAIMPIGDFLFGQKMIARLKFLEEAQWWDKDRIIKFQNQELSKLVKIAYQEVPFYRYLFDAAKVSPDEIQSPKDLQRLPIVSKDMLRKDYPNLTTRSTGQKTYEASTSGSTGKNFYVREDAYTAGWYRASFMLALEWSGWNIGEKHLQTGMTLDRSPDRWLKDSILRCYYVSAYDLTDNNLDRYLSLLDTHKIKYLWGYPGSLYYLAQRAKQLGWNMPLKSAVTWGDNLIPFYRSTIENAFHCKVFDTYGCAEGIQISAQCGHEGNYHQHGLDVVVDILMMKDPGWRGRNWKHYSDTSSSRSYAINPLLDR